MAQSKILSTGVMVRDPASFNAHVDIVNVDPALSQTVSVEILDWGVDQVWNNPTPVPVNPSSPVTIGPRTHQSFISLITQSTAQPGLALALYEIRITIPDDSQLVANCFAVDADGKIIEGDTVLHEELVEVDSAMAGCCCVDSMAELKALNAGAVPCLTVLRYYAPGDGGGGNFYWDASAAEADNAGTTIAPASNPPMGRWKRLVDGPISVKWFGATGDPSISTPMQLTAETAAINSAFIAAALRTREETGAFMDGASSPAVIFPKGHYRINDVLQPCQQMGPGLPANGYFRIVSTDQPVIEQTDPTKQIIYAANLAHTLTGAHTVQITGISFYGGKNQIYFESNESASDATIRIDHCEFYASGDYAIMTALTGSGATHYDGIMTIEDCRFVGVKYAVSTYCDRTVVRGCLLRPAPVSSMIPRPEAVFKNLNGRMELRGCECAGPISMHPPSGPDYFRWVSNYGSFYADGVKFGGEGGGMPIVHHYSSPEPGYPFIGDTVSIVNSVVASDVDMLDDEAPIVLVDGVPQTILFKNNQGPVGSPAGVPIVRVPTTFGNINTMGLAAYLETYPMTKFHVVIQADLEGGNQRAFPVEVLPYVSLIESSPFPAGSEWANSISGTRSAYTYYVPAALQSGFVAMVTVSVCPNNQGSAEYRTVATYIIAMTTGYTSNGLVRYLTATPVAQPTTPGGFSVVTMDATFPDAPMGWDPHQHPILSAVNQITVTWDSHDAIGTMATYASVSIVPIHGVR